MTRPAPANTWVVGPWVLVAAGCLVVFFIDLVLVVAGTISAQDRQIDLGLHRDFGTGTDPFFSAVSNVAAGLFGTAIIIIIAIGLLIARRVLPAVLIILAVTGAAALDAIVKLLVQRPRPELFHHAVHASGYSFPSGHSTNTVAFFAVLLFLLIRFRADRWMVGVGCLVSIIATLLVGLSRITLGVHYPTDVLGGYALSAAWCISVFSILPGVIRPASAQIDLA